MNPKRSANRRYKKDLILEKAIEVFAKKGSQQTTISDIAKAAKIAQGTIYVYFNSKEALLNECMQEIIGPVLQSIIDATKDIPDTMDRLFEFFIQHIRLVEEKPYIARFLTIEARQNEDFYESFPNYNPLRCYLDFVESITEQAISEKRIRAIDSKAFAILLVGAMDFAMCEWLIQENKMDIADVAKSVREILKFGINE